MYLLYCSFLGSPVLSEGLHSKLLMAQTWMRKARGNHNINLPRISQWAFTKIDLQNNKNFIPHIKYIKYECFMNEIELAKLIHVKTCAISDSIEESIHHKLFQEEEVE